MRLPRWLVTSLLTCSASAVLGPAGWWWVTWPERTARDFVGLVSSGSFEEATTMVVHDPDHEQMIVVDKRDLAWEFTQTLVSSQRTLIQFAVGRQHFTIGERPYEFVVQHGRIVNQGRTLPDGRFKQADFLPLSDAALTDPFKVPNQIQIDRGTGP